MQLDILAFGVHPDDVELGCSGTLLSAIAEGKKVGIVDLTRGELGTRGTAETRNTEAQRAAQLMGVSVRTNLQLADGFFENNQASQLLVIQAIRQFKPQIVLCNAPDDRHPDHGRSAQLVQTAAFLSGLSKIQTLCNGQVQTAFRPSYVFHYLQDKYLNPSFVVDISAHFHQKLQAILCYTTQFHNPEHTNEPPTYISSPQFLETVEGRARLLGKRIGVQYAEGFISDKMLGIQSFNAFVQNPT